MKNTIVKKFLGGLIFGALVLSGVSCSPKKTAVPAEAGAQKLQEGKKMEIDALKGKEGVFAVLETEKGTIVLNLFYKDTPMTVTNFVGLAA